MERDRPPDKHRHRAKPSGEYQRVARNDKPIMEEQEPRVHKANTQVKQQHTTTRGPRENINLTGLAEHNDFIQRWLAQTEDGPTQDLAIASMRQRRSTDEDKAQLVHADIPSRHTGLQSEAANEAFPTKGKRRHNSSSDSSLLEPPTRPKSQQLVKEVPRRGASDRQEDGSTPPRKKQRIASSDSGVPNPSSVSSNAIRQSFEKRARHKTRDDRYEPKKETKSKKARGGKSSKKKRGKSSQKAGRKSGTELVHNFSSKSIRQDRLTIRPSNGPGLFKNGRASSPARRRGLPDLAFSEMEFLQHSSRYQPPPKDNKIKSKAREKEKRKTSRAQEEISDFFKPKVPLKQVETYNASSSSIYTGNEYSKHNRGSAQVRRQHSKKRSQSFGLPEKQYLSFGKPGSSSDRRSTPRGHSPVISYPSNIPNSDSRLTGKATTYVSWSESQTFPQATGQRFANVDRRNTSPIPESIRRSIEETRIFQNTGIGIADRKQPRATPTKELLKRQVNRSEASEVSTSTAAPTMQSSGVHPEAGSRNPDLDMRRTILRSQPGSPQRTTDSHEESDVWGTAPNKEAPTSPRRSNGPIIEHFDHHSRWHPQPSSTGASRPTLSNGMTTEAPQQFMSAPIDRGQLAMRARIKRPSTILPLIRQAVSDQALGGRGYIVGDKHEAKIPAEAHSGKDANQGSSRRELAEAACLSKSTEPSDIGGNLSNHSSSQRQRNEQMGTKAQVIPRNDPNDESRKRNVSTNAEGTRLLSASRPSNVEPHIAVPHPDERNSAQASQGMGNFFLGPPVRGSWINSGQSRPLQATRFSPLVEVEPLFIHQIPRHPLTRSNFHHGDKPSLTGVDEIQNASNNNGVDFVEDYSSGVTEGDQYGNLGQQDEFSFLESYDEIENYETGYLNESNSWNFESYPVDGDGENYDLVYDNGEEVYEQQEIAGGSYGVDNSVQIWGQAELQPGDELHNFGEHSGMQGFWRPRQWY